MKEREGEVYHLFREACWLDGRARERWLADLASRDAELAAELRSLLESDEQSGAVPPESTDVSLLGIERARERAGHPLDAERLRAEIAELAQRSRGGARYELGEELGRGAMGRVRRVVDLPLRRELAMKTIRADAGGPDGEALLLARFLNEARVLGRLCHPGIVSIHELGVDAEGRPFFTMPIVQGGDLRDAFARARSGTDGWSLTRAVGVLQRVCEAMAFAHANGIVHRDLKPSNVMVGRFGEVQVMDWGVARVRGEPDARDLRPRPREDEGERATDSPVCTTDGAVIGTPFFMSPEQALGRTELVDGRSDVYAVGAMLYELLADRRPYEDPGKDAAPHAVLARLLEREPTPLAELAPDAPPELVAICAEAMAREPSARYATMEALAGDLRAFLEGRVVRAYRTGALEELAKWTRRNRGTAAALAAALAVLLGGAVAVAVLEAANARRERELAREVSDQTATALRALAAERDALAVAEAETARAKQTIALMETLFRAPQPSIALGREITVREVLDHARVELESSEVTDPEVLGTLQTTLGKTYQSVGEYDRSIELFRQGIPRLEARLGAEHPTVIQWKRELVDSLKRTDRFDDAIALGREVLDVCVAVFGPEDERTIAATSHLGLVLRSAGHVAEGEALIEEAYRSSRERFGLQSQSTLGVGRDLLPVLVRSGRIDEALALARAILDGERVSGDEPSPQALYAMDDLGSVLADAGRFEEGEKLQRASFDGMMRVLGPDHEHTYYASHNLGDTYLSAGRLEEAREQFEFALFHRERLLGPSHRLTLRTRDVLVRTLVKLGALDDAERLANANDELSRDEATPVDVRLQILHDKGFVHEVLGDLDTSVSAFEEKLALQERTGAPWADVAASLETLVRLHIARRDLEAAAGRFEDLLELVPPEHASRVDALAAELDAAQLAPREASDESSVSTDEE